MQPFDIYRVQHPWGGCNDPRPWLILDIYGDTFGCVPISSRCYPGGCFCIECDHYDFRHTGLAHTSYVTTAPSYEISRSKFHPKARKGHLTGTLLELFRYKTGF